VSGVLLILVFIIEVGGGVGGGVFEEQAMELELRTDLELESLYMRKIRQ
jgi:hypothetical protein